MATMTTDTVADVVAGMLTEPTGASILDSGGAYGRNWERNAGMSLGDWQARPRAIVDRWGCITVDVFHYLTERLSLAEGLDSDWLSWAEEADPDDRRSWLDLAVEFAELRHEGDAYGELTEVRTFNTYNGEDYLSQILQGAVFCHGDSVYVLLQIHGGCDARGGYTRPRVFEVNVDMAAYFPYDNADASLSCPDCDNVWDIRGGVDVTGRDGYLVELPECGDDGMTCPDCGTVLVADGPYPC